MNKLTSLLSIYLLIITIIFIPAAKLFCSDWTQNSWTGGGITSSTTNALSGHNKYDSADSYLQVVSTGLQIQNQNYSWTQTDDGTTSSGYYFTGNGSPVVGWTENGASVLETGSIAAINLQATIGGDGRDGSFNPTGNTSLSGTKYYTSLNIPSNVTVSVTGNLPLIIYVQGNAIISGTINANGGTPTANNGGGGAGGTAGSGSAGYSAPASGGGIYGSNGGMTRAYGGGAFGGNGGSIGTTGNGGTLYGSDFGTGALILYGGSGGGGGSGGAGGGVIAIIAGGSIRVKTGGIITANGGSGVDSCCDYAFPGGGGSGGGILLNAPIIDNRGTISVNGGNGGLRLASYSYPSCGGGGGRTVFSYAKSLYSGTVTASGGTGYGGGNGGTGAISNNTFSLSYLTSGNFTSAVYDTANKSNFGVLTYNSSVPSGGSLSIGVMAGNTASPDSSWTGLGTFAGISNGGSLDSFDNNRYIQYKANFTTTDVSTSPVLNDITFTYSQRPATATLVSSAFNSGNASNIIRYLKYNGIFPANTSAKFQLRTTVDNGTGLPNTGSWTSWLGPTSTNDYYTDGNGDGVADQVIISTHSDGATALNDQWIQYKVWLRSEGTFETPHLSTVAVTFVFPPPAPALNYLVSDTTSQITANWTDNSMEDEFIIYSATFTGPSANAPNVRHTTAAVDSTSYSVANLSPPNTQIYARLRARTIDPPSDLYSSYSAERSTYTKANIPASPVFGAAFVSSMTVSWGANNNPNYTRYVVEISSASDFSGTLVSSTTKNTSALMGASLTPNTTYYAHVRTLNELNIPTDSVATTPAGKLTRAAVPGLNSTSYQVYATSMTINWGLNGNPSYTQFQAMRGDDPGFGSSSLSSWMAATSLTYTGLAPNSTYYFKVKARNLDLVETDFTTLPSTQTLVYQPGASVPSMIGISSITVNWGPSNNNNPGGIPYTSELSIDSNFSAIIDSFTAVDTFSNTFVNLSTNTLYYFRVRAQNTNGTRTSNVSLPQKYTKAAQPLSNTANNIMARSVNARWMSNGNPAGGTDYYVEASTYSNFSYITSNSGWITDTQYNFSNLSPGTTHYFRVKARNGDSTLTDYTQLPNTLTLTVPADPTNLAISYVDSASTDRLRLNWTDNATDESGYSIEESSISAASGFAEVAQTISGINQYDRTALEPNVRYYYQVRAYNGNGNSEYTSVASTYTKAAVPSFSAFSGVTATSLQANWGANSNTSNTTYSCELSSMSDFSVIKSSVSTLLTYTQFNSLAPNTTYYLKVRALNGAGYYTSYLDMGSTTTLRLNISPSITNLAPASLTQGSSAAILKIALLASGSGASFASLTLQRTGTGSDGDVKEIRLHKDNNGSGAYENNVIDPAVSAGSIFSGGNVTLSLTETLSPSATYFVIVTFNDTFISFPDNTIGARVPSLGSFSSTNGQFAAGTTLPFDSNLTAITKAQDTLTITAANKASANAYRNDTNLVFEKLTLNAETCSVYIKGIKVDKTGSLPDAYIPAIRVYKDANASAEFESASDTLLSSGLDVFSSSSCIIDFTSSYSTTTINTSNTYLFITLDIASNAPLASTLALSLASTDYIRMLSNMPDVISNTGFPITSAQSTVNLAPSTMTIATADMNRATITQGQVLDIMIATVSVNSGSVNWTTLKIGRSAQSTNSDYGSIRLYRDADGNSAFSLAGDALVASTNTLNASGVATLSFSRTITTAPEVYFIVLEAAPGANTNSRLGVTVQSGYITLSNANSTIIGLPFTSALVQVQPTVDSVLACYDSSFAPSLNVDQNASDIAVFRFGLKTDANSAQVSSMRITQIGTAADSDVEAVRIYNDVNNDGALQAGLGELDGLAISGDFTFSGGTATVSFSQIQPVSVSSVSYFVAVDLVPLAVPGRTIQLAITNSNSLGVLTPDTGSSANLPIVSNQLNIQKLVSSVIVSSVSVAPSSADAGASDIPVEKLTIRTNQSTSQWDNLFLVRLGGSDSDVKNIKLFQDFNGNGPETPEIVSSGTFSGGMVTLSFAPRTIYPTDSVYYVTISISSGATVNNSIGLSFQSMNIYSPDTAANGSFPFNSPSIYINEPPSTVYSSFQSLISSYVVQGQTGVLIASMTLYSGQYSAYMNNLSLMRLGTGSDSDASIKLYADANSNGAYDPIADGSPVGTGSFSGSIMQMSVSTQTISTTPKTYFILASIATNASYNKTFGVSVQAGSYLGIISPDVVSDALAFPMSTSLANIEATIDTLLITAQSMGPTLTQGDSAKAIGKLTIRSDANAVELTTMKFNNFSTIPDSEITNVRVFKDNGNGTFSVSEETLVSPQITTVAGGYANMNLSPVSVIEPSSQIYWLAVDISSFATVGSRLILSAPDTSYFTIIAPDLVSSSAFPITFSAGGTIQDRVDTVTALLVDAAPVSAYQGTSDILMAKVTLSVNEDYADFTSIRLNLTGTGTSGDISQVKLYRDNNSNGTFESASDVLISTATFSGTSATLSFAANTITTSKTYFIVYDISTSATISAAIGCQVLDKTYITISSPDTINAIESFNTINSKIYDPRVPTAPAVSFIKADNAISTATVSYMAFIDELMFNWDSTVIKGSIIDAEYSVGTTPGSDDLLEYTATASRSVKIKGLNMQHSAAYYISVKAKADYNTPSDYLDDYLAVSDVTTKTIVVDLLKPSIDSKPIATNGKYSVRITWPSASVGPSGVLEYQIEERRSDKPSYSKITQTKDTTFVVLSNESSLSPSNSANLASSYQSVTRGSGTYYYRVRAVNGAGVVGEPSKEVAVTVGLDPSTMELISPPTNYPNPFDSRVQDTVITYTLNQDCDVDISIYSLYGHFVKKLQYQSGSEGGRFGGNSVSWDGTNDDGAKVSHGGYIAVITAKAQSSRKTAELKIAIIH